MSSSVSKHRSVWVGVAELWAAADEAVTNLSSFSWDQWDNFW